MNKVIDYENYSNSSEKMIHQAEENLLVIKLPAMDLKVDDLELPNVTSEDQNNKSVEKSTSKKGSDEREEHFDEAVENVINIANSYSPPKLSYSKLIYLAIQNQPEEKATLQQIYNWIMKAFPYYSK